MRKLLLIALVLLCGCEKKEATIKEPKVEYYESGTIRYIVTPGDKDPLKGKVWSNVDDEYYFINLKMCTDKSGICGSINHIMTPARNYDYSEPIAPGDSISFSINRTEYDYGTAEIILTVGEKEQTLYFGKQNREWPYEYKQIAFKTLLDSSYFKK